MLAAFKVLLARWSGQEDLVVGTPIAGRQRTELEGLIGFFVNTLALRTDVSDDPSFVDLLARVKEVALGGYDHQDLPFEKLVEELQPERDASRNPIFQVMFAVQNALDSDKVLTVAGLSTNKHPVPVHTTHVDLSVDVVDADDHLAFACQYNTDLFDPNTIERLTDYYVRVLEIMVADSSIRLSSAELLSESERDLLLMRWNATSFTYPADATVVSLFEAQVDRSPEATALIFGEARLSYRELNRRANQLARHLQNLGVGPEVVVGLCTERSLEMVVGMLGTLKAGGAYVPLEPIYPEERLKYMVEDTGAPVLLTQHQFAELLPSQDAEVICLDADWKSISTQDDRNLSIEIEAAVLAYVIYTSGSTGDPKGVMIEHGALANHMLWMQRALPLTEQDRVLQKTAFSFDASIWEFYAPLLAGAQLVMAEPHGHLDLDYLANLIQRRGVSVLEFAPASLQALVEHGGLAESPSLRRILSGGDVLRTDLAESLSQQTAAELFNAYGPTEATIGVTIAKYDCAQCAGDTVPLGRPIDNVQLYVLDNHQQLCPIGRPGELHIGGACLARGYLNRPDLTAERFVANPFWPHASDCERLYRTGDLVRYRADGQLEFIARVDDQIKVRGFRIEPGEVEAALLKRIDVDESVVIAREDTLGDKRLVAYVVPAADAELSASDLRTGLIEKLPEHMVPSAFVVLDELPFAPSGKVDRRALPPPDIKHLTSREVTPPITGVEKRIAEIFCDFLPVDQVDVHANFFELGGHSLLATQVVSRLRKAFSLDIPLIAFFQGATITEIAMHVEALLWARGGGDEERSTDVDSLEELRL
jgi:amino acid adenylation domain-containing protein